MPEEETDEFFHPGMAGRRAYNTEELSASSEDEEEYRLETSLEEKGISCWELNAVAQGLWFIAQTIWS